MKIRQYVYFAIKHDDLSAEDIARLVGMRADRALVKGSRSTDPVRPRTNAWEIVCDRRGATIDEQIAEVLDRLRPIQESVKRVLSDQGATGVLEVVRHLGDHIADDEGEEDEDKITYTKDGTALTKLPGQHHLLGWHLDASVLRFLADMGAEIDVDEYA